MIIIDCQCNTVGTVGASAECTDNDGVCSCDSDMGYQGTKCDDCQDGWYWTAGDNSCTSKLSFLSSKINAVLGIVVFWSSSRVFVVSRV